MFSLIILGIIVWLIIRASSRSDGQLRTSNQQRDQLWRDYIASFQSAAKTKGEKQIIESMMAGDSVDMLLAQDNKPKTEAAAAQVAMQSTSGYTVKAGAIAQASDSANALPQTQKEPMDGTLLLLYFGAFLFIVSAGLFVAFAGLNGAARTLVVAATMTALYGGGLLLHSMSSRMRPAGIAFVAIGMAIAPLVGVAAYYYLDTGWDAKVIWLGTSVLCALLYT